MEHRHYFVASNPGDARKSSLSFFLLVSLGLNAELYSSLFACLCLREGAFLYTARF